MLRSTFLLLALPLPLFAADKFEFKDGDKVVLIGSTLIEREQRYGYWEAALTARNPDKNITFRNLGWSGDTVWGEARAGFGTIADGYKQLVSHVIAEKPTVIIVGYGTNESFAGPDGLPKFKKQLKKLLDDLSVTKARFVLLSPMKMFKMPPPLPDPTKANENLKLYGEAIKEEAERRDCLYVNLLGFQPSNASQTVDGMQLSADGYWSSGQFLAESLKQHCSPWSLSIDVKTGSKIIIGSNGFFINLRPFEFRLANNSIPEPSPENTGPFQFLRYTGIPNGKYEFTEDGKTVAVASEKELAKGIEIHKGSSFEQFSQLRQAIIAKNKLYFYRWRPQNVTYLFGFRKHEQGNNAIEIPKFDPLIAEKEKEIAKLRVPREHVYELVPIKEKK